MLDEKYGKTLRLLSMRVSELADNLADEDVTLVDLKNTRLHMAGRLKDLDLLIEVIEANQK